MGNRVKLGSDQLIIAEGIHALTRVVSHDPQEQ